MIVSLPAAPKTGQPVEAAPGRRERNEAQAADGQAATSDGQAAVPEDAREIRGVQLAEGGHPPAGAG